MPEERLMTQMGGLSAGEEAVSVWELHWGKARNVRMDSREKRREACGIVLQMCWYEHATEAGHGEEGEAA